jgi:hypothetical protein
LVDGHSVRQWPPAGHSQIRVHDFDYLGVAAAIIYAFVWLTRGRREYVEVEEVREEKGPAH